MSVIASTLSGIQLGAEQTHDGLVMIPLIGQGLAEPDYLLLDQAIEQGMARVTEISESGSVPTLRFENNGDLPVLLLDGEELIGAKQNRILNLSVLAPANQSIEIPVSCVEAGRWSHVSAEFSSAKRAHYAAGRARKAAQVSLSMSADGSRYSDQGAVWEDISEKSARLRARSGTAAAAAMYESRREQLDDYEQAYRTVPDQLGVVFVLNGQVISLDLFDCAQTCAATFPKLVQSCALDALDAKVAELLMRDEDDLFRDDPFATTPAPRPNVADQRDQAAVTPLDAAGAFLNQLAENPTRRFDGVGEGEDLRFEGEQLSGGALVAKERLVHLCAFPSQGAGHGGRTRDAFRRSRIARASHRRSERS